MNPSIDTPLAQHRARHLRLEVAGGVATLTLDRPERKNPLTFESYRELADFFWACQRDEAVKAVVIAGAGGNFSSGGDVFEIIEPLTKMPAPELLRFTRMTGDLVKAMKHAPQPIVAAIDGICAGAGAMIALRNRPPLKQATISWVVRPRSSESIFLNGSVAPRKWSTQPYASMLCSRVSVSSA